MRGTAPGFRNAERPGCVGKAANVHEKGSEMSEREKIEPHDGDVRFQRRKKDGTFGKSDDASKSLSQDVRKHSSTKKPRNQGDKGD